MPVYGQPTGPQGYDMIDVSAFVYWMPVLTVVGSIVTHPYRNGYKVHVSVDSGDADRVARRLLPELQSMTLDHKVVYSLSGYIEMNASEQQGKFITIYSGPLMDAFTRLVGAIDPILQGMSARPGPHPMDRESGHTQLERRIGRSGLLFYVISRNYQS
jgi:hypothetical protein